MSPVFHLTYFDPPPDLARHVLALFHFVWDEAHIADRHPGALGQLTLFPYGTGELHIGDDVQRIAGDAHMLAGFERAASFTMDGPWHAIGASLSPLGWAALAQAPASSHFNRFVRPSELLGPDIEHFARVTNEAYRSGTLSGEEACYRIGEWISEHLGEVPEAHEKLIERVLEWLGTSLNPDTEALFPKLSYSRRQSERLIKRYFGLAPRALSRKFRAIRAANLLAGEALSDEAEAEIGDAFFDQPHMIREIRRYCGYTPTRLGGGEEPVFETMIRMKNLERLGPYRRIE